MNLNETTSLSQYREAGGQVHSSANQRVLSKLVDREVIHCCSMLVSHVAESGELEDEVLELMSNQDYKSAWEDSDYELAEDSNGSVYAIDRVKWPKTLETVDFDVDEDDEDFDEESARSEAYDEYLSDFGDEVTCDNDDYHELCEAVGVEPYENEAYEHWVVTNWFSRQLREKGEIVGELFDFEIWGRCTTGQAISMDGVIADIAAKMGILEGQRYSWAE